MVSQLAAATLAADDIPVLDTGNNSWMLASAALVLLMTPGLAFFYGGMVRRKTVINMLMMSFSAMGTVGVVYVLWGYSMSFSSDVAGGLFGNPFTSFGMKGLFPEFLGADGIESTSNSFDAAAGVTALTFVAFQLTFAIITVALISGSVADRMKFSSWLVFSVVWVTVVYFPLAHMVWGGGLLSGAGSRSAQNIIGVPMDFAGGTVVHIDAGIAGHRAGHPARQAPRVRQGSDAAAQRALRDARRRPAVVRLVRVQRRFRGRRQRHRRAWPG